MSCLAALLARGQARARASCRLPRACGTAPGAVTPTPSSSLTESEWQGLEGTSVGHLVQPPAEAGSRCLLLKTTDHQFCHDKPHSSLAWEQDLSGSALQARFPSPLPGPHWGLLPYSLPWLSFQQSGRLGAPSAECWGVCGLLGEWFSVGFRFPKIGYIIQKCKSLFQRRVHFSKIAA